MGDVAPGDAGDPDDLEGAVVEPVEADEQHVGQLGGIWPPVAQVAPTSSSTKKALPSARSTISATLASAIVECLCME